MKIAKQTDDHLLYVKPQKWIQDHFLPHEETCGKCGTSLTLDFISDFYPIYFENEYGRKKWHLGFTCMVCGSTRVLTRSYDSKREPIRDEVIQYYVSQLSSVEKWVRVNHEEARAWLWTLIILLLGWFFLGIILIFV